MAFNDRFSKLQRAADYHKLLRYLSKLDSFLKSEDYENALKKLAEFDRYLNSLKKIRSILEAKYVNAFSAYLPVLGKEMTTVYCALTRQKSFDTIRIVEEPGSIINKSSRKMVLQVGSLLRDMGLLQTQERRTSSMAKHLQHLTWFHILLLPKWEFQSMKLIFC